MKFDVLSTPNGCILLLIFQGESSTQVVITTSVAKCIGQTMVEKAERSLSKGAVK